MAQRTGSFTVADLIANKQDSAATIGFETIAAAIQQDLDDHNRIMDEAVRSFADPTADRQRSYGTSGAGDMIEVDEFGRTPTQKPVVGVNVGFPLRAYQFAVGWTRKYLQQATVGDLLLGNANAQTAHARQLMRQLQRAIYLSANYTFRDRLVAPIVDLAVKRFVNADGASIPNGPNGETYDGATHTHYLANATLTAAAVQSLVDTILEHGLDGGKLILAIAQADRTAFEALTGFKAYADPRIQYVATDVNRATIDLTRMDDLAIGTFGAAEVWVKPWALSDYVAGLVVDGATKPLVVRTRSGNSNLNIAAEIAMYPLQAQYMEAEFGVGVWNRTRGGVLYAAGGAYADPTV